MNRLKVVAGKVILKKALNHALKNKLQLGDDAVLFIENLKSVTTEIYVVGGFIRNILNDEEIRDIDLMVSIHKDEIPKLQNLFPTNVVVNRLGGFKLLFEKIEIDLWTIETNWASKNRLIAKKYHVTREIAKGAFYNFDGLAYSLLSNVLHCYYYNKCIERNELDIILYNKVYLSSNPNRTANVLRAFYLKEKYGFNFSEKLKLYIDLQIQYHKTLTEDVLILFAEYLEKYPKYKSHLNQTLLKNLLNGVST